MNITGLVALMVIVWVWGGATTASALLQIETIGVAVNGLLPEEKKLPAPALTGKPWGILLVVLFLWPIVLPMWLYFGIVENR